MADSTSREIAMPRLSDSMEEGTILAWRKRVGDRVAVGEEIAEIETDKANMAFESDLAGTVLEIVVREGEAAAVGAAIARIGDPGAAPPSQPAPRPAEASSTGAPARPKASPLARRLAEERGVDLSRLPGSGPGGRIVKADVESAAPGARPSAPAPAPPAPSLASETAKGEVTVVEPSRLQQVVARRMSEAKATAPHFYLTAEVDMAAAVGARERLRQMAPAGELVPSFNDMVVKACAIALREFPHANGVYRDGCFELYSRVNVGIAAAAADALLVPTIFDADRKGLREIAADARRLAARARDGEATPSELSAATFAVSNLGMYGIRSFDAVVNSPQAGILAVGEIADVAAVRDGEVVAAKQMSITLSCDHRILYGAEGAQFLARVKAVLEEPVSLAL